MATSNKWSVLLSDPAVAEMVRRGNLTLPARPADDPPPSLPVTTLDELLRELAADREDR